ncbi:uncharacterized protein LOC116732267 isoform X2 [Xiphophorus hellerii]|uniref:uncharacterized protein LOC116732267 isoform X2 n=1 Tax=Xiphophorus hellerii TaxID=8084 RepID=UPI0013B45B65|nr:uncharacterized protein LOC116732267 isoform X2 [Xiphophorus hellerii]
MAKMRRGILQTLILQTLMRKRTSSKGSINFMICNIVEEKDGDLNEDDEEDNNGVVAGASRGRKRSREGPASKRRGKRSETHVDTQVKWKTEKETDHLLHPPLHFRYKTVLHHFIDIAVTNSYLIHKEMCAQLEQKAPKHQAFQEQLTVALCGVEPQAAPTTSYRHLPVAIFEGASVEDKATKGRRKCKLCGKCTPFMCEACKLPLCVIVDRNCHKDFHSSSGHAKK